MTRNRQLTTASGEAFTYRVERTYVAGFSGESLLYLFRPEDGSPRFTYLVAVPASLVPRLGPEFDRLAEAGTPAVEGELATGVREDRRIELCPDGAPRITLARGLRKFPPPGADGGEVGSWG